MDEPCIKSGQTWNEYVRSGLPKSGMCRDCEWNKAGFCSIFKDPTVVAFPKYCKSNKMLRSESYE